MNIREILEGHEIWIVSFGREGIKADLSDADLSDANLRGVDLRGADLSGAYLSGADLRSADLREANLRDAYLSGADLRDADLSGADLRSADLRGITLCGTCLPRSTFIIFGEEYFISITNGEFVQAGCQRHSINEWREFSKHNIAEMDGKNALRFYPRLLDIIDLYCGKGKRPDWLKEKQNNE